MNDIKFFQILMLGGELRCRIEVLTAAAILLAIREAAGPKGEKISGFVEVDALFSRIALDLLEHWFQVLP